MQLGEPSKMQAAINITPLVDVVLVLLIIFMVVAPQMRKGPDVHLPDTTKPTDQGDERGRILVTIDDHGALWIDDQPVTAEHLGDELRAAAAARAEAEPEADVKVVIRGDARLQFGEVRQAMLAIEQTGAHGVGLIAKRAEVDKRKDPNHAAQ
jgi:biopolymer transport protein TolR